MSGLVGNSRRYIFSWRGSYEFFFSRRPSGFDDSNTNSSANSMIPDDMLPPSDDSDNEDIGDMVVNANRPQVMYEDCDTSSDDDSDDNDKDDET